MAQPLLKVPDPHQTPVTETAPKADGPTLKIYHNSSQDYSQAELATIKARFLALFIDIVILGIIQKGFLFLLRGLYLGLMREHFWLVACIWYSVNLTLNTYYSAWPLSEWGQTIGKKLMGIKVVSTTNHAGLLTFKQAVKREIIGKFFSIATLGYGFLRADLRPDREALHDSYAQTRVIKV